jgi:cation transport ATPase
MNSVHAPAIPRTGKLPRRGHRQRGHRVAWLLEHRAQILASIVVTAIAAGGLLHLFGAGATGQNVWRAAVALLALELTVEVGRSIVVERSLGVDTIALVAMVGSLALGQELAGAVIGLMFSGGAALEAVASRRARRELTARSSARRRSRSSASTIDSRKYPSSAFRSATSCSCEGAR